MEFNHLLDVHRFNKIKFMKSSSVLYLSKCPHSQFKIVTTFIDITENKLPFLTHKLLFLRNWLYKQIYSDFGDYCFQLQKKSNIF